MKTSENPQTSTLNSPLSTLNSPLIPPGYKQTEVGVIPEDWEVVQIGELKPFVTSGSRGWAFYYSDRGSLFVRITNLSRDTIYLNLEDSKFVNLPPDAKEGTRTALSEQDVLISITADIGIVGYIDSRVPMPAYINQHIALVRLDLTKTSSKFVGYFLASERPQKLFRASTDVGAKAGMSLLTVQKLKLALPPTKAEQEAIAAALSDADALIESLEQLLTKKRHIKQGAMQEILTGKKRLPGFSGEWESSPLKRFVRQFIVPMRDKPKRLTGEIPWCRIEDFEGMYLTISKSGQFVDAETVHIMNLKVYPTGTLLVSCSADLGRCAIVARPLVSNQTFIGLQMDEEVSSNVFFFYFMTSRAEELNNLSSGTTISYLSRQQFEDFIVIVPLDKEEQTAIAAILSDMDAEIAALGTKLSKTRHLKQGMMQELLTGKTRLVDSGKLKVESGGKS